MEPGGSSLYSQEPVLVRTEELVWFRGFLEHFVSWLIFYDEEVLVPRQTPKLEDRLSSAVRDCLFNTFAATFHIWRQFLHPQPEGAPCRVDRDPLNTGSVHRVCEKEQDTHFQVKERILVNQQTERRMTKEMLQRPAPWRRTHAIKHLIHSCWWWENLQLPTLIKILVPNFNYLKWVYT
jgi:hypothetical protein